jgi:hypothetical protein
MQYTFSNSNLFLVISPMAKAIRIIVLLLILATVTQEAWLARSRATSWQNTLTVGIYPIAGDATTKTQAYVGALQPHSFKDIEEFFDEEAKRHGLNLWRPLSISLAPPVAAMPPPPPHQASMFESIAWSLHMRWWAWRHDRIAGPKPSVRLFVLFHDPETKSRLAHSVGLERGLVGVIHAFASPSMAGSNNTIIVHELLHTLGASDKYDATTNLPRFPDGYADPQRQPRYPQDFAEIMGGRIPVNAAQAEIPHSLTQTLIGQETAQEIKWLRP